MSKKILALDLDETLLNSDKSISPENEKAINKMLDEGHILAIDSGRPIPGMKPVTSRYDFFKRDNVYLLGMQGGYGFKPSTGETLFINFLHRESAVKLAGLIKNAGFTFLGFDRNYMYVFEENAAVKRYNRNSESEIKVINSEDELYDIELCKIICVDYDTPDLLLSFEEEVMPEFSGFFTGVFSCPFFLEFINKETSKGKGLLKLADICGVRPEDTIACGDERNDITMIRDAGIGVCVANGHEAAKEAADYITTNDNNHGAIAEVIYKFIC